MYFYHELLSESLTVPASIQVIVLDRRQRVLTHRRLRKF